MKVKATLVTQHPQISELYFLLSSPRKEAGTNKISAHLLWAWK